MNTVRTRRIILATSLIVGLPISAVAAPSEPSPRTESHDSKLRTDEANPLGNMRRQTHHEVVNVRKFPNKKDTSRPIASCEILRNGSTCTISKGATATRTVQVDFGVDYKWVSSKIGVSASKSQTVSVGCVSPPMKKGQIYRAWAVGDWREYRIHQWYSDNGPDGDPHFGDKYSKWLYSFSPYPSAIACG